MPLLVQAALFLGQVLDEARQPERLGPLLHLPREFFVVDVREVPVVAGSDAMGR
jgi:hypothetical protein